MGIRLSYSVVLHGLFGQTVGKRVVGVCVYDVSGGKLSMRQAALRDCVPIVANVLAAITQLPRVVSGMSP
jgi:uncharacterized RDD family membrane protein YckC